MKTADEIVNSYPELCELPSHEKYAIILCMTEYAAEVIAAGNKHEIKPLTLLDKIILKVFDLYKFIAVWGLLATLFLMAIFGGSFHIQINFNSWIPFIKSVKNFF